MKKCAVVVVTYNRKAMLCECIAALLAQSYERFELFIIDNAGTDGTADTVAGIKDGRIRYYNTGKNIGGAGGFSFGMKKALTSDCDYIWMMDDDSVPDRNALEDLVEKAERIDDRFSFLASTAYWTDGKLHPSNFPRTEYNTIHEVDAELLIRYKLIPVTSGSFVGCFVNRKAAEKVGLPIAEYFIYGDDVEYTHRLKRIAPAYLDLESTICHKSPTKLAGDIVCSDVERLDRFYYQSRNGMSTALKEKQMGKRLYTIAKRSVDIVKKSPDHKLKRLGVLYKGSIAGLFFRPEIEYPQGAERE